jgi:chorismate mutase/prephenate dehydratase
MTPDAFVQNVREQISENDRAIVDAINRRLELVAALKRYKEANGIPLVDPQREESLVRDLQRINGGPLSDEGLERAVRELLDLTKREVF